MSKELTISDVTLSDSSLINKDQFNFLFKNTPQDYKYTRPAKGGGQWTYVKGTYVKKVLNFVTGFNWDFEVVKENLLLDAKQVIILGRLTARLNGQEVVKMQYGRADIKFKRNSKEPLDLGNDFKAAATDALKKCASELGVAQDVYGADDFKPTQLVEPDIEDWQKARIEYLLPTSTYNDEERAEVERHLDDMSRGEANGCIQYLEMNQLPNHPGYNDRVGQKQRGRQVAAQVENPKA